MRQAVALRYGALLAILVLAALLRFYNLPSRGFIYWDEGKFALEGVRMAGGLSALAGGHVSPHVGKTVGTAKPTHALLIGLADSLLGVHDYSALLLEAASSVAGVLLTYLIARRLWGEILARLAALFLAVSQYDVIYARSALSESDANACFLVGVLLWLRAWERRELRSRALAGLFLGLSFTVNYRLIVYCLVLVAFDLLGSPRPLSMPPVQRGLVWAGGLVALPLLWQVADLVGRATGHILFRSEFTGRPVLYVQQALYQLHQGKQARVQFNPLPYLHWYLLREGWPLCVLIILGGVSVVASARLRRQSGWRRAHPRLAVPALVLIPYAIYVFAPFVVPRNLDATLPFASMLAACGLPFAVRLLPPLARASALPLALLLIAAYGVSSSWQLTPLRSGFSRAALYVDGAGGRALVSNEVMRFYLRGSGPQCDAPPIPVSATHLTAAVAHSFPLAVLDSYGRPAGRAVAASMPLLARFPVLGGLTLHENLITSENGNTGNRPASKTTVSVYRLVPSHMPGRSDTTIPVCDRDRT